MRRFRFSLRVLFVLVAILAVLLGIGSRRVLDARKQRQLITLIQSYGGENHHELNFKGGPERTIRFSNMEFSPALPGPDWLRRWLGDEYFVSVAEAFFNKPSHRVLDDESFRKFTSAIRFKNLPRPTGLFFSDLPLTDTALDELTTFPDLTSLHIVDCPEVTDAGLKRVESLQKLRRLDLRGSSITDDGLSRLADLKELRELCLKRTAVSDDGLVHLKQLKNLEWLALGDTSVTTEGAKGLKDYLPNCVISW